MNYELKKRGPDSFRVSLSLDTYKRTTKSRLLSVSLADLAVPLHGVIYLEIANDCKGRTVVVTACSARVGSTAPCDVAGWVAHYEPLGLGVAASLGVYLDAGWEEYQEVTVEVRQGAREDGHLVDADFHTTGTGNGITLTRTVVLGGHLTGLVLELNLVALQRAAAAVRRDGVLVLGVVDGHFVNEALTSLCAGERNNHAVAADASGVLLALISAFENGIEIASHNILLCLCW